MANYLVASGSRKISDLEIASFPIPEGSGSILPMVIGNTFPITNGTSVQIQTRDFIDSLVFNASGSYTGNNVFSGSNTFTGSINVLNSVADFSFETPEGEAYNTLVRGGLIAIQDFNNAPLIEALRIRATNSNGFIIENATSVGGTVISSSILTVGPSEGRVDILRETHFSQNVIITGSLTALEIFTTYETASILYSSGSTKFGDTIDDEHLFSGSIILTGSLVAVGDTTLDGVNLSVFSSSVQAESQSFALRLTQDEADLALLSSSYETFSGSQYNADSASFSADITENSSSLSLLSGSYENFSGSQYNADSASFSADITENSQSLSLLSSSYENFSGSQYQTDSGSFSTRLTGLSTDSASFSIRVSAQENFSSSQYNAESQSFSADITENSQSLSLLSGSFLNVSGSFSTRVTQNEGDISILSASFETTSSKLIEGSGSFSTRVTDLESFSSSLDNTYATDLELQTVSQSFETDIDNLSGSISTRFTTDESNITENSQSLSLLSGSYETSSGSFSTRVTNQEGFSSSFDSNVLTYIDSLGVFSGSEQVDADNVTNFDSNVLTYIDSLGVFSGSEQVDADNVTNFDSNVLAYNNSLGVVSGSSQVVFNDTSLNPFISTSAAISASNHLVPSDNEVYDLGTPTQRWRDLYLSGSTIDLGGLLIQRGTDGNVQFIDSASQAPKTVTIDSITGSLDISGSLKVTGSLSQEGDGIIINRTTSGEPFIFFNKNGVNRGAIYGNDNTDGLRFFAASGSLPLTVATASVSMDGNVSIINGNLSFQSGKGIDFSATPNSPSGSSINELLDDYEEGTWTPTVTVGSLSSVSATYTKIGRVVHIDLDFTVGTGGATQIEGLPFNVVQTTGTSIYCSGQDFSAGYTVPTVVVGGGSSILLLRQIGDNVAFSTLALTTSAVFHLSFTYNT